MNKPTTVEKNNRFYEQPNGEILTENEQLKEWLIVANKEIERLNNIINELEEWAEKGIKEGKESDDFIYGMRFSSVKKQYFQMFLDKIKELKGEE